jgi:Icc-related predicted phosphoesterase
VCPAHNHSINFQHNWSNDVFIPYLEKLKTKYTNIVFCAGNHDFVFEKYDLKSLFKDGLPSNIHYLQNNDIVLDGVKIWGSPYSNRFFNWAFMEDEDKLNILYSTIPSDTDIIISHGPAYGYCDTVEKTNKHLGSKSLLSHILRVQPKILLTGHIHSAREEGRKYINNTMCECVSYLNESYTPKYPIVDLKLKRK